MAFSSLSRCCALSWRSAASTSALAADSSSWRVGGEARLPVPWWPPSAMLAARRASGEQATRCGQPRARKEFTHAWIALARATGNATQALIALITSLFCHHGRHGVSRALAPVTGHGTPYCLHARYTPILALSRTAVQLSSAGRTSRVKASMPGVESLW